MPESLIMNFNFHLGKPISQALSTLIVMIIIRSVCARFDDHHQRSAHTDGYHHDGGLMHHDDQKP